MRHAARTGGLFGATADEATSVDEVLEGIRDARGPLVGFPFTPDVREAIGRVHGSVQRFFPCFETILARNAAAPGAAAPFAVGGALTMADVLLAELYHSCHEALASAAGEEAAAATLSTYGRMTALHDHVLALDQIRAFVEGPNWFPFPAGNVGKAYVRNVRTVLA